jgi:hypothetical protein
VVEVKSIELEVVRIDGQRFVKASAGPGQTEIDVNP